MPPALVTALLESLLGFLLFAIYVALAIRSAAGPARAGRPAKPIRRAPRRP